MNGDALNHYHPAVIFTFFCAITVFSMCSLNPIVTIVSIIAGCIYMISLKGILNFMHSLPFYIITLVIFAVINALINPRGLTLLFYIRSTPITLEAFLRGMMSGGIMINLFMWFSCYNEIMTGGKFIALFGRIAPTSAMMISMILRYIPENLRKARDISMYQKALIGNKKLRISEKIRWEIRKATVIMTSSMEDSIETASSMVGRGYSQKLRTVSTCEKFNRRDAWLFCGFVILIAVNCLFIFMRANSCEFYPYIELPDISPLEYSVFAILAFMPIILRAKERLEWMF